MATALQKNLAQNIAKNAKRTKPLNKKELVISSGYAVKTAEGHAPDILDQKGVQEELENLGFDSDSAKKVVKRILTKGKEENQLKAADMIFKVHGEYAPDKTINLNVDVEPNENVKALTEELNALHRGTSIGGDGRTPGAVGPEA